jgi:hypothetical protein
MDHKTNFSMSAHGKVFSIQMIIHGVASYISVFDLA